MPNPTDVHTLRSFIGLCNYYRIYVQDFNIIIHPLYALLKKDVVWTWSDEAQEAFNAFKEKLSEFPILKRLDFNKVFILHTDQSALGIGAIFCQLDEENKEYVIAYASWSNNKAESNYFSYKGECFTIVWAVIHFRPYLYGINFTLYINYQLIKWLMTNDKLTGKLVHWVLILQEYEFKVIHRPGITHQNSGVPRPTWPCSHSSSTDLKKPSPSWWPWRNHPQADGLAERMVQTCKKGFRKICLTRNKED